MFPHRLVTGTLILPLLFLASSPALGLMMNAPRISVEEARERIDTGDVTVIDVRLGRSWDESRWKIPGAVRRNPQGVRSWMKDFPRDQAIILYCS